MVCVHCSLTRSNERLVRDSGKLRPRFARAAAFTILAADLPTMRVDDGPAYRETKTYAGNRGFFLTAHELVEYCLLPATRETRSAIFDCNLDKAVLS